MECATAREALSAVLDGEDPGVDPVALDEHVARCPACLAWHDEAAAVTRLARVEPALPAPDLADRVLDHLPPPRRSSRADWPRWVLGFAAVAQLSVVVSQLLAPQPMADGMAVPPGSHLEHEAVAFNFAVAAALLWAAVRPRQARSQLPVLLGFAVPLIVLSLVDVVAGRVGWERLTSHVPLLFGVFCAVLVARGDDRWPWPGARARTERTVEATADSGSGEPAPADREHRPPAARAA